MAEQRVFDSGITEDQLAEWERAMEATVLEPWILLPAPGVRENDRTAIGTGPVMAAPFIAVASVAMPALFAEVRRLRAEIDDMRGRALEAAEAADRDE